MLLTAWVEDSTQTVMAATEVPPEDYEPSSDGLGLTSKGYQQITSWQVALFLPRVHTLLPSSCDHTGISYALRSSAVHSIPFHGIFSVCLRLKLWLEPWLWLALQAAIC